jgi:hypothetical protein
VYEERRSRLRRSKRRPFVVALVAVQLVAATVTFLGIASVEESAHLDPAWAGAFIAIPLASILVLLALLAFGGVIASVPILVADCLGVVWAVSGIRRGFDVPPPIPGRPGPRLPERRRGSPRDVAVRASAISVRPHDGSPPRGDIVDTLGRVNELPATG